MTERSEYQTGDVWIAALLDVNGIPLLRVEPRGDGRSRWIFQNAGDCGWQLASQFRLDGEQAVVSVRRFRDSFRLMLDLAHRANQRNDSKQLNSKLNDEVSLNDGRTI